MHGSISKKGGASLSCKNLYGTTTQNVKNATAERNTVLNGGSRTVSSIAKKSLSNKLL
jgi:hypothetical protein